MSTFERIAEAVYNRAATGIPFAKLTGEARVEYERAVEWVVCRDLDCWCDEMHGTTNFRYVLDIELREVRLVTDDFFSAKELRQLAHRLITLADEVEGKR